MKGNKKGYQLYDLQAIFFAHYDTDFSVKLQGSLFVREPDGLHAQGGGLRL